MTRLTIDLLPQVDAVILPIHARSPFSMTEKNFVCQLLESDNIHDILFVVTFLDQLDEDDYVYENYMRALSDRIRREVFAELESRDAPGAGRPQSALSAGFPQHLRSIGCPGPESFFNRQEISAAGEPFPGISAAFAPSAHRRPVPKCSAHHCRRHRESNRFSGDSETERKCRCFRRPRSAL